MSSEPIRIELSPEEFKLLVQLAETVTAISGARQGCQQAGPFINIDDRCKERWKHSTKEDQRRVRDVFVGKHRERLGRYPCKENGHINGAFVVEPEHVWILDSAIDTVRDEVEEQLRMPLYNQPRRGRRGR